MHGSISIDTSQHARATTTTLLALATTIVLWSAAFVGIRAALPAYGPLHLALLRFLIASSALAVSAVFLRVRRPARRDLPRLAACGLVGISGYNLALNAGEVHVSAGAASMLVNTAPLWTALLAVVLLGERFGLWGWLGVAISFSGAALIALSERDAFKLGGGAVLVLLAAGLQSCYFVLQKPLLARYRPIELASYAMWSGTIGLLPFLSGLPATVAAAPLAATVAVVFLGIGPAALAYVTWSYALAQLPAARAASALYLVPPTTLLLGWLWLGELPATLALLGGAVAIGGVVLTTRSR